MPREILRQSVSYSNDADVNFDSDVQKRKELLLRPTSDASTRNLQSMGFTPIIHSAAAITTGNEEAEENYPNFDSACSTVLTNSMLNCRTGRGAFSPNYASGIRSKNALNA